jgi:hypothetical protein
MPPLLRGTNQDDTFFSSKTSSANASHLSSRWSVQPSQPGQKKKGVQHIRQLQTELKSRLANLSRGPSGHRYDKGIYDLAVTIDLGLGWQGRLQ